METCSSVDLPARRGRNRRRLLVAIVVSSSLHVLLAAHGLDGGGCLARPREEIPFLTARVMPAVDAMPSAVIPPNEETADEPLLRPVREAPIRQRKPTRIDLEAPPAGSSALAQAPDRTYYAARELDVYPLLAAALDLPALVAGRSVSTRVLLLVSIDESGLVNDVSVVEAESDRQFEEDAKRAFMLARFIPALKGGRAVRSRVLVHIGYAADRPDQ